MKTDPWWKTTSVFFRMIMAVIMLAALPASAEVVNLYQVSIPVPDQGLDARQKGFEQGLAVVIQRLTGQQGLYQSPEMEPVREKANGLVERFNYTEPAENSEQPSAPSYQLQVTYSEKALNKLLRGQNVAIWGENRPSVLIWMVQEKQGQRSFTHAGNDQVFSKDFQAAAEFWGVPVVYPLFDFEDSNALDVSELWGLFADPILKASGRYGVKAVMAVRTWESAEGQYSGQAVFLFRGENRSFDFQDLTPEQVSEQLISSVAGVMAGVYAVAPLNAPNRPLRLQVEGITQLSDYAGLLDYLGGLTAVRRVNPVQVKNDSILLDVIIDGSVEQLQAAIALNRKLVKQDFSANRTSGAVVPQAWLADIYYQWRTR